MSLLALDMATLKTLGAALLLMSLLFFIIIKAIDTRNYIRKAVFILIAGIVIILILVGGIIYDVANSNQYQYPAYDLQYFAFLIVATLFTLISFICYYVKGYRMHLTFKSGYGKKQKLVRTVKDKKEHLYIILKVEGNFLLKKIDEKEESTYTSISFKFPHTEFFHDELLKSTINNLHLDVKNVMYNGTATVHNKKDEVYYCYTVDVNTITDSIKDFYVVTPISLINYPMNKLDKKILYTSLIQGSFDVEV